MPVYYDEKTIIPAPIVSINSTKNRIGDSRQISNEYSITLSGTILPFYSGIFNDKNENIKTDFVSNEALDKILEKQNELRNLFSEDGKVLEIQGWNGAQPDKFIPIIESINFTDGLWVDRCDYTITMTATRLIGKDGEVPDYEKFAGFNQWRLSTANDQYSMSNNGDGSAEVTRSIDAKGMLAFDENSPGSLYNNQLPWQQASGWCEYTYNEDIEPWYSGILESCLPNFRVIDTKISKSVSPLNGDYSIEQGWLISNTGVYILGKSSTEEEERERNQTGLSLAFDIQGIGFTSPVKSDNASTYWSDKSITSKDEKIEQIKTEFSDIGAAEDGWYFSSYSEVVNKEAGSIGNSLVLTGSSGVFHSYTINPDTNWIDLPDRTLSINGTITGVGDNVAEKLSSALSYYQTIDFNEITEDVRGIEFETGDLYTQTQSLSTNNETGEVSYTREFSNYEAPYKDTWTIDNSRSEVGDGNIISIVGSIKGLSSDRGTRWAEVYSYFTSVFTSDQAVWALKVASVLGASVSQYAFSTNRTFSYDETTGTINYSYSWNTVDDDSGEIDYTIDSSYDVATDVWTITTNGVVKGAGNTAQEKVSSAFDILPHENEAWQYSYETVVKNLDNNSTEDDNPRITEIPNQRSLISRNFSTDDKQGIISFTFVWSTGNEFEGYAVESKNAYSWNELTATETISVNGTIRGFKTSTKTISESLDAGWDFVFDSGDPDCPVSLYAARHNGYFKDHDNIAEELPTYFPVSSESVPTSILKFNRAATLVSSSMERDDTIGVITYNFQFVYKAWRYNLPLWFTNVSISFNNIKSIDKWVRKEVIGKRTGPVHQLVNSRNATAFNFSVTINTSKRKADQFGSALYQILEEYTEYIMRQVFLENSGLTSFNYSSEDPAQNCYIEGDSFNLDIINGSVTRSNTIYLLDIIE